MPKPMPFRIAVPDATLERIMARVRDYDWHEMPAHGGWAYGTNLDYLRELCAYWTGGFDWRAAEAGLNRFPQFIAEATVEGETIPVHFIHEKGSGPHARPLIISHGWPGSFFEFLEVIEPLAHPERFGGSAEDAFDVVVPSLIGYGFSGKPRNPMGPRRIAAYLGQVMSGVLGYQDYIAQGGDWGSVISAWLGHDDPACAGVHLNMYGWRSPGVRAETDEEKAAEARAAGAFEAEGAYFRLQMTKPQSLSYAMMDSPVGVAAWLVEKFNTWSHTDGDNIESAYTKDQLLTNIMIYLVTRTFNTASWQYRGLFEDRYGTPIPPGQRLEKPTAIANFPFDNFQWPPRSMVEKSYNVVRWSDIGEGGHFAALERPARFVEDVRSFGRLLRG
ncbi:MAG: epoxide hydrolase family protein [Alphaproteobacteria bacterium]